MVTSEVTATISTNGRFHTTLPLVLTSIANQTLKPERLIIYDDNEKFEDLRENEIYKNLFHLLNRVGIKWEVLPGKRKGQVHNHQQALKDVTSVWIWRLDDDNILTPDTLKDLYGFASSKPDIGAVGPLILDPKANNIKPELASNKIEDIYTGLNIQWFEHSTHSYVEVDHLQGSTFLFRREAAPDYDLSLSKTGHREETIFTHEIKRKGWKLVVLTWVKTWHMFYKSGGIRTQTSNALIANDEAVFTKYLEKWKIVPNKIKVIPLDNGIGDHYAFRMALPFIRNKYKNYKLVIGACFPEVFLDEPDLKVISLAESFMFVDADKCNLYKWMDTMKWKGNVISAFETMV